MYVESRINTTLFLEENKALVVGNQILKIKKYFDTVLLTKVAWRRKGCWPENTDSLASTKPTKCKTRLLNESLNTYSIDLVL